MIKLIVIDTETGGLDPAAHCVIEIAAKVITLPPDGWPIFHSGATFSQKVHPDRPVDPKAAEVNGYSEHAWRKAEPYGAWRLQDGLAAFYAFCAKHAGPECMWAGCNPRFDRAFIESDCKRHGVPLPKLHYRTVDIESLALPWMLRGAIEGIGLRHMRKLIGLPGAQSHTAMRDVDDAIDCLSWLLRNQP